MAEQTPINRDARWPRTDRPRWRVIRRRERPRRRLSWWLIASLLLHLAPLLFFLLAPRPPQQAEQLSEAPVTMLFESGKPEGEAAVAPERKEAPTAKPPPALAIPGVPSP